MPFVITHESTQIVFAGELNDMHFVRHFCGSRDDAFWCWTKAQNELSTVLVDERDSHVFEFVKNVFFARMNIYELREVDHTFLK